MSVEGSIGDLPANPLSAAGVIRNLVGHIPRLKPSLSAFISVAAPAILSETGNGLNVEKIIITEIPHTYANLFQTAGFNLEQTTFDHRRDATWWNLMAPTLSLKQKFELHTKHLPLYQYLSMTVHIRRHTGCGVTGSRHRVVVYVVRRLRLG